LVATSPHRKHLWVLGAVVGFVVMVLIVVPTVVVLTRSKPDSASNFESQPRSFAVAEATMGFNSSMAVAKPCIFGSNTPAGCTNRIYEVPCQDTADAPDIHILDTRCSNIVWGQQKKVRFQVGKDEASKAKCYQVSAWVSECWGNHPRTGSNYECQGRCGAGCTGLPGGWAADCWKHDICSWFFGAADGTNDANCGLTYKHCTNDLFCSSNSQTCFTPP